MRYASVNLPRAAAPSSPGAASLGTLILACAPRQKSSLPKLPDFNATRSDNSPGEGLGETPRFALRILARTLDDGGDGIFSPASVSIRPFRRAQRRRHGRPAASSSIAVETTARSGTSPRASSTPAGNDIAGAESPVIGRKPWIASRRHLRWRQRQNMTAIPPSNGTSAAIPRLAPAIASDRGYPQGRTTGPPLPLLQPARRPRRAYSPP